VCCFTVQGGALQEMMPFKSKSQLLLIAVTVNQGMIYKISYGNLTIVPELRSIDDGRLICQTSYEERRAFLRYDSLGKSSEIVPGQVRNWSLTPLNIKRMISDMQMDSVRIIS